jgi:hypothetical protein
MADSVVTMTVMDEIRRQVGIVFAEEGDPARRGGQ